MERPKRFVIDRSKWRRGGSGQHGELDVAHGDTRLLNKEDMRCCLGFVGSQCGLSDEELDDVGEPQEIKSDLLDGILTVHEIEEVENEDGFFSRLDISNSELTNEAMEINDDSDVSDAEREQKLTELFNHHGYELEFVDGGGQ